MTQRVQQQVVSTVADAAVTGNILQAKIAGIVQTPIGNAAQTLLTLQQPIVTGIVGQIGSALEGSIPLGVNPPQADANCQTPLCVAIRSEATQGITTTAFQYYQQTVLPLLASQPLTYQSDLAWIEKAIGTGGTALPNFMHLVSVAESRARGGLPGGGTTGTTGTGTTGTGTTGTTGTGSGAVGSGTAGTGGIVTPIAYPVYPNASLAQAQAIYPASCAGQGQLQGTTFLPPEVCIAAQMANALDPGRKQWATNLTNFGSSAGEFSPATCGMFSITGTHLNAAHASVGLTPGLNGKTFIFFEWVVMTPVGPNNAMYTVPTSIDWTVNQLCGSGTGTTTTPPPPPPPPPPTTNSCENPLFVQICNVPKDDDDCPHPPPPEKPDLCVWQSANGGVCYIGRHKGGPRDPSDTQVTCGDPLEWSVSAIVAACQSCPDNNENGLGSGGFGGGFRQIQSCDFGNSVQGLDLPDLSRSLLQYLGFVNAAGDPNLPFPNAGITDLPQNIGNALAAFGTKLFSLFLKPLEDMARGQQCASGDQLALIASSALVNLVSTFFGTALDQVNIPIEQEKNFNCPTRLPSETQAAAAWLANTISDDTLTCWVKAAGFRPVEFASYIQANRSKLDPLQVGLLRQRELIEQADYENRMRERGFIRDNDAGDVLALLKVIPPPSDLVRFMVRDAADEQLVNTFGLDTDFDKKFSGKLKDWARYQGVDEDYMKFVWRAHWSIPSPGQLADMLHRLSRLDPNDKAYVDLDTIRTAMEQQDIAPFWIDKFIATSYRPLTRIDARRAFEIGALDPKGLKEAYLNLGYADAQAQTLVDFNTLNRSRTFARRPEVAAYAKGELSDNDFEALMIDAGAGPDDIDAARGRAQILARQQRRKVCVAAIKKRFLVGEFDTTGAIGMLNEQQLTTDQIRELTNAWQCEADSRGKAFTIAQLTDMYDNQIIDAVDFQKRLMRLGFSSDDAVIALRLQMRKLGIKQTKLQTQLEEKAQREQDKLARQLLRQANRDEAGRRQEARNVAKMQSIMQLRNKRLIEAGEKWSEHSHKSLPDAIIWIRQLFQSALSNYPATNDEVIAAMLIIAGDKQITTTAEFTDALATALAGELTS